MKKLIYTLVLSLIVLYTFAADNCKAQGWSSLGSGMNGSVTALTVFNNELIAGGNFTTAGGVSANRIAKWNGTTWTPLGSGMDSSVQTLVVFNNELIAGGLFTTAGGVSAKHIAKWNGTSWAPLGTGTDSNVYVLEVYNNELIAGGNFVIAGGVSANRIAKWNGTSWAPLGSGVSASLPYWPGVYSIAVFNSELVITGEFTVAGGVNVNHIAKWNGTSWAAFTSGVTFHNSQIGVYNNEFVASSVIGYPMAKWSGANWVPLGSEVNGLVKDLTIYNNELIAGGIFYHAGIDTFRNIGKWNGTSWSTIGSGLSNYVYSLTVFNNDLIVGGAFTTAGGISANRIAKWRPAFSISGSVLYSDNNQPATNGYIRAVKLDKNTGNILILDSAQIQPNGTYTLSRVQQDSIEIVVCPNSYTQTDWVVTYSPSTIYWQNAATIYPVGNTTGINIGVARLSSTTNSNSVNGKVMRLNDSQLANLKDAVLYAKNGNTFVRCGMSDVAGVYHLPSLPVGSLKIIVNRLGFTGDSVIVNVTSVSNIDSINFNLYKLPVGINQIGSTVPTEYLLHQNYPNPFNSMCNVQFTMCNAGNVKLVVYDVRGREVQTLVNERLQPGTYETSFDGSMLNSGVYFYKLTTDGFSETKRMLLIK